jgi:chemotaxis signal transduction protein
VTRALIPLKVQKVWIALDASCIREILGERPWVRVPPLLHQVPGVLAWQGRAIALLDLGTLGDDLKPLAPGERRSRTLVANVDDATLAIPVDEVMTRLGHCAQEVELDGIPRPLLDLHAALHAILASGG